MDSFKMSVSTYQLLRRAWGAGLTPFSHAIIVIATVFDVQERQVLDSYRRIYEWEIAPGR